MAYRRLLEDGALMLSLPAWVLASACTSEQVVMVEPAFVEVTPADVSAIEGDQVQLIGAVHDDEDNSVTGSLLEWSSADTSVATVDGKGLVTARAPGSVAIRARFEDVTGTAKVEVLRGPFVVVVPASVSIYSSPGVAPAPQVIAVSNGGAGALEELTTSVRYDGEAPNWLRPTLESQAAPTSFTLRVEPAGLGGGRYPATVTVASRARGDPANVGVVLNVAGFELRPSGPGTTVAESGTTDQITVVLSSQPSGPVVLLASSSDPSEATVSPASVRFTRTDWDDPQTITVRGVNDIDDDANQVSTVTVAVDGAQSPDAYDVLAARTMSVTTLDDDEPPGLVIVESLGSTVVSENNTTDSFTVTLASAIAANVVLEIASTDPYEVAVLSSAYLTFTPGDWNAPQTVTVIGINDLFPDGNQLVNVTVRVLDLYSDDRYDGLVRNVLVTNVDNGIGG